MQRECGLAAFRWAEARAAEAVFAQFLLWPILASGKCSVGRWCERGDSNPHGFTRQILSLVRLPIPPLSHGL